MIDFVKLSAPFEVTQVSWRVMNKPVNGSGPAAAFLDARDIMDRLDEVCGPENWQVNYQITGPTCFCSLGIKCEESQWVHKEDGAGATDFEAEKGQISSALKRAAVCWGIGRYLYNVRDPNTGKMPIVQCDQYGNIPDHQMEYLYSLLPNNKGGLKQQSLPGQAKTEGVFWTKPLYNILDKLPLKLKDAQGDANWSDPETIAWLYANLPSFITRAPSRLHLVKLQADNLLWIKTYMDEESKKSLSEMFVVRATQFDQLGREGQDVKKD